MNGQELPDYKKQFLQEMQVLRRQQIQQQTAESPSLIAQRPAAKQAPIENNIINTAMYSGSNWRQQLNGSSYGRNHDLTHHQLSLLVNPQVARKQHNIQLTAISQYSNAMHNKTVFINPKSTSC